MEHKFVVALRDLALELGRTPSRAEYESKVAGANYYLRSNGGFTPLLQAANLRPADKRPKIDSSIFQQSLERHLDRYEPTPIIQDLPLPHLAAISDIHWPFHSQRVIERLYRFVEKEQPEIVLIDGDAWDMYSHAKFPRSHNLFTPREEQESSRQSNQEFWVEIKKIVPDAKCYQMLGNHDVRPLKRVLEVYPAAEDWIKEALKGLFTFEGVETIYDPRQELMLGSVMVHHGYRSQLGAHRDYALYNAIVGHTHRGGTVFRRIRGQTLWELNCGLAGDPEAKGLTYTPQRITEWTPGFGAVNEDGPRFIPC